MTAGFSYVIASLGHCRSVRPSGIIFRWPTISGYFKVCGLVFGLDSLEFGRNGIIYLFLFLSTSHIYLSSHDCWIIYFFI